MLEQTLINGLLLGGVYALVAIGFSVVWGVANVINITHASFVMLGAYCSFWLFSAFGLDPFLSVPITALVMFLFGYLLQRYLINLILGAGVFMTLVLTYGLHIFLINTAIVLWTANYRAINPVYSNGAIVLGDLVIPYVRLAAFLMAVFLALVVHLFLTRTRPGLAIMATAQNREAAQLVGIAINHSYALTYGLGAALAGVGGVLIGTIQSIHPGMGDPLLATAFIVTAIGGLGSIGGALAGGLLYGVVQMAGATFLGQSYQEGIGFALLVIVLVVRPEGLFGRQFFAEAEVA